MVKCNNKKWLGYLEGMDEGEVMRRIYKIRVDAVGRSGLLDIKFEDRVLKYFEKKGGW